MTELALVFLSSLEAVEEVFIEDVSETPDEGILSTLLPRLSRLPRLQKIRLPSIHWHILDQPLPQDVAKSQSSSLLEIQFVLRISSTNLNVTHIAWYRPDVDAQFALANLVLASRPPARPPLENMKALGPSLSSLASLALETISESDSTEVLRKCKSLRRLSIMSIDFPAIGVLESIPRTLEYLSLVFTSEKPAENNGTENWDRQLSALLISKRTPMLRELRISRIHLNRTTPEDEPEMLELELPLTKLICENRGIDFDEDLNWMWSGTTFTEAEPADD